MKLGWKVLVRLAVFNVAMTAILNVLIPDRYLAGAIAFVVGLITIVAVATLAGPRTPKGKVTLVKKQSTV
jgi:NADH-quinone oxidoreductase subunit H